MEYQSLLQNKDNYTITAKFKCASSSELCTTGFYIRDYNNTSIPSSTWQNKGNTNVRYQEYLISSDKPTQNHSISEQGYNNWHTMKLTVRGASVDCEVYDNSNNLLSSFNNTIPTYTNTEIGLLLFCETGSQSKCYIKDIVAEAL